MGIGGHILGPKKLRQLNLWSGIPFDRAYNRNGYGEGRLLISGACIHLDIDFRNRVIYTQDSMKVRHWTTCDDPDSKRVNHTFKKNYLPGSAMGRLLNIYGGPIFMEKRS